MKNLTTLLLTLLFLGGCGDSEPKPKTIDISLDSMESDNGKADWYVVLDSPKGESNIIQNSPKDIVFEALFDRCEEFGWLSEEDISACIKQEAFRVTWPTGKETVQGSLMVVAMAIIAAIFFLLVDQIFKSLLDIILKVSL